MPATLDPIASVLRVGPRHRRWGDPWVSMCVVQHCGPIALVHGLESQRVWAGRSDAIALLREHGIEEIHGLRIKNGKVRHVVVRI